MFPVAVGEIAAATNLFGRGMGKQRIETVLENYPDILTSDDTNNTKIERVKKIPGMAKKTATQFVEQIPRFIEFLDTANLREKLTPQKNKQSQTSKSKSVSSKEEQRLLTKQNTRSKSPSPVVIQGKNRKWTIKAKRTSTPRTSSATRRRGRGKRKKQPKRNRDKPSRNRKP